ncbi:MAG: AMP-binding protein [Lawsonella sp.]|nr:AMP-binding protein [Mycobacteriales bacterium]
MPDTITPLVMPEGAHIKELYPLLEDCLAGTTPPLLPVPTPNTNATRQRYSLLTQHFAGKSALGAALIMATSGTTGVPKGARLSAAALRASCASTHAALGGPGRWLLAVPAHHIIGMQVLLRSLHAGHTPLALPHTTTFQPAELLDGIDELLSASPGARHYMSLVPSQLDTLLQDADSSDTTRRSIAREALAALRDLDGIVSGGAPIPAPQLAELKAQEVPVVPGYGSSEVAGGVLFNGRPGPATTIALDPVTHRISIGGETLADGYVEDGSSPHSPSPAWETTDSGRWFHTQDVGHYDAAGRLIIDGRLDEAINSGGLIVMPQPLEASLQSAGLARDVAITGEPDSHFGECVVAIVIPHPNRPAPTLQEIQGVVEREHGRHAVPRRLYLAQHFPRTGSGKLNRNELKNQIARGELPSAS